MRLKLLGRDGVWYLGRRWSFSYWPPKAWLPLGVRLGRVGRKGWWGAAVLTRREDDR